MLYTNLKGEAKAIYCDGRNCSARIESYCEENVKYIFKVLGWRKEKGIGEFCKECADGYIKKPVKRRKAIIKK